MFVGLTVLIFTSAGIKTVLKQLSLINLQFPVTNFNIKRSVCLPDTSALPGALPECFSVGIVCIENYELIFN